MVTSTYCDNPMGHDPRPDLMADHALWEVLLVLAERMYGRLGETTTVLHGMRCLGAGMEQTGDGDVRLLRIVNGEIAPKEYGELRAKWMAARVTEIRDALSMTAHKVARADGGCPLCAGDMRVMPNEMMVCDRCEIADLRRGCRDS